MTPRVPVNEPAVVALSRATHQDCLDDEAARPDWPRTQHGVDAHYAASERRLAALSNRERLAIGGVTEERLAAALHAGCTTPDYQYAYGKTQHGSDAHDTEASRLLSRLSEDPAPETGGPE